MKIIEKPKRVGRRPKGAQGEDSANVSRESVLAYAMKLVEAENADTITIARLAADMGVSTSMIHYLVTSRDALLAAVLNECMRIFVQSLPAPTGEWRADLASLLEQSYAFRLQWPGVATYLSDHNRYRLFHEVKPGQQDYGLVYFDCFGSVLRGAGFSAQQAAMAYHLAMLFVESVSISHLRRRSPIEHQGYLTDRMKEFDSTQFDGAAFMIGAFSSIDSKSTFSQGLELLLDGFEGWLGAGANTAQ